MKIVILAFIVFLLCSFQPPKTLKGTWEFVGGIYNGKKEGAPTEYALHKKYGKNSYEAFVIEKGEKPEKYETGNYTLNTDTCTDTETFSSQPSQVTNIPIRYLYSINNDTLKFKGTLPSGMTVEEYWKKIR